MTTQLPSINIVLTKEEEDFCKGIMEQQKFIETVEEDSFNHWDEMDDYNDKLDYIPYKKPKCTFKFKVPDKLLNLTEEELEQIMKDGPQLPNLTDDDIEEAKRIGATLD